MKITQGTREFWILLGSHWGGAFQGHSMSPPKVFRASKGSGQNPRAVVTQGEEGWCGQLRSVQPTPDLPCPVERAELSLKSRLRLQRSSCGTRNSVLTLRSSWGDWGNFSMWLKHELHWQILFLNLWCVIALTLDLFSVEVVH